MLASQLLLSGGGVDVVAGGINEMHGHTCGHPTLAQQSIQVNVHKTYSFLHLIFD
jgi:hypothetical protein